MARKNRNHKDIRCPRCGGSPVVYQEVSTQVHEFAADESGIEEKGELESSNILYVVAVCGSCDHEWKLRGINQITDLQN
ncbi:hypothetical protein [Vibrio crassostreae]|uniref:hypothetical protein n=1 Tax=Vibrio crassostreae TaxID=246167 RepID=UPI00063402C6|nr:hypothetical protein [Vibrio crassostreae]CDT76585.1 hypothetical protein VCRLGP8_990038 [Vibrio crassostreae]